MNGSLSTDFFLRSFKMCSWTFNSSWEIKQKITMAAFFFLQKNWLVQDCRRKEAHMACLKRLIRLCKERAVCPLLALFFSLLSFLLALFPPSVFWNMSYLLICSDWARVLGFVRVTADWFGRTKNLHNKMLAANGGPINTLCLLVSLAPHKTL